MKKQTAWKSRAVRQLSLLALLLLPIDPAWSFDNTPWGNLKTEVGPDAEVPGWFINLGITGARAMITMEEAKKLQVMFVFKRSPAYGKLETGDKITGANKRAFTTAHKFGYPEPSVPNMAQPAGSSGSLRHRRRSTGAKRWNRDATTAVRPDCHA